MQQVLALANRPVYSLGGLTLTVGGLAAVLTAAVWFFMLRKKR